jgi:hypothetical protein
MDDLTPEEIQRKYDAALNSVTLLAQEKPVGMADDDWADRKRRNVEHLKIMVAKDYWQGQDLAPLHDAIAAHDG